VLRVGLTGGIGSGKSTVAAIWRERGVPVIDADDLADEVVAPGSDALREIAAAWPQAIAADGTLDRPELAGIIFVDADARRRLNAIVHPRVRALADEREAAAAAGAPGGIVVHAVPLLFESDYAASCQATVVVVAPEAARVARVIERDGWSETAIRQRMLAQIDPEEARRRADYAIENDGDLASLRLRANAVLDRLLLWSR
jgi:dephospho-CoA kinase